MKIDLKPMMIIEERELQDLKAKIDIFYKRNTTNY